MMALAWLALLSAEASPATLDLVREQRVAAIGYRLAAAGHPLCPRRSALTGFVLHDIAGYDVRVRASVEQAYGMGDGFGLRLVVPDSAADRSGLKPNDVIVAAGGIDLAHQDAALIGNVGSPARSARATAWIADQLAHGPLTFAIRRGGQALSVTLQADTGCAGFFVVSPDQDVNAWSDGSGVAISARLVDMLDDAELAFALAHEMAHNILGHAVLTRGKTPALTQLGIGTARLKAAELEADAMGVGLMRRAGYPTKGAEAFLRVIAGVRGPSVGTTHPRYGERIARLRALAEDGRASGAYREDGRMKDEAK